jgi:hypothetical protein
MNPRPSEEKPQETSWISGNKRLGCSNQKSFILYLSVPLNGKNRAVEVKCIPILVELLKDKSTDVRANAAGALMM